MKKHTWLEAWEEEYDGDRFDPLMAATSIMLTISFVIVAIIIF